jgi:ribonuclease P protein component
VLSRGEGKSKLGIIATRKFGCAVKRNRVKRLIKEAFRRGFMNLPDGLDFVVIPKKNVLKFDSKVIFDDLCDLGESARRLVLENNTRG